MSLLIICFCMVRAQADEKINEGEIPDQYPIEQEEAEEEKEKQRYRLLPIPIAITEPAIGEGLGVTLALFHPVKEGKEDVDRVGTPNTLLNAHERRDAPPVVTAVAGAYTNNDTWIAGVAHTNNWRNDSIRYTAAAALADVHSEIYLANRPIRFNMETTVVYQSFKYRLGSSDFLVGAGLSWLDADTRFRTNTPETQSNPLFAPELRNSGLAATLLYDTRDNAMQPARGQLAELEFWRYAEGLGGDFDYWAWNLKALAFFPLADRLTFGLRLQVSGVDGDPPFFAYPYIKLRGIAALRYQDRTAGVLESELRYQFAPRWEASVFGGLGHTSDDVPLFQNPDDIHNYGLGLRYKIFNAHNVWMGMDVARGPEDWNWYIQVGHPW